MALNLNTEFGSRSTPADSDYPQGSFKNTSAPTANDGTPINKRLMDDIYGFLQSILAQAEVTPNDQPDSNTNRQYLSALAEAMSELMTPATQTQASTIRAATLAEADNGTAPYAALTPYNFDGPGRKSIAVNGYQHIPGLLLEQWGEIDVDATGVNYISGTFSFPKAFPNACFGIVGNATAKWDGTSLTSGAGPSAIISLNPSSASQGQFRADSNTATSGGTFKIKYRAVGY